MAMKRFIRLEIITTILFLLTWQLSFAQISNVINDKKFRHTRFLSVARSSFDVNGFPSSPSYSSLEFRLGVGIVKSLGAYFELKSGLNLGLKVKRKSYFFGPLMQFTYEPWVMPSLDETASGRNHLYADIPLALQCNLLKTRIGLKGGLNFRLWAPNDASVDVLTAKPEVGMHGGISYHLAKGISIGVEHYYGLTDILNRSYFRDNPYVHYRVRNQSTQITIEQIF